MISASEAERLAPRAVIDRTASDDSSATAWKCRWRGDLLPGENGSAGEIEIEVKRYKKTGESAEVVAARKYAFAVQGDQSLATRSHKEFVDAPVRRFSGIGDSAHGQYSRSRTGSGYDVAKGSSRVGDVIVGVQYRPGEPRAAPPRGDIPPAAERAALREAESLLRQVSESVTDWRAGRPYARPATPAATPAPTGTPAPAATPTPVPVDFAANCAKFGLAAARLVPDPKTGASRTVLSDRTVVDCWWENADLPASRGLRLRNVSISVLTFTNRAGNPDPEGARRHYEERRDRALRRARDGVDREYPGISFTEVTDLPGTDDPAYVQYRRHRAAELQVGVAGVLVVVGGSVIEVSYAGSERPGAPGSAPPDPSSCRSGRPARPSPPRQGDRRDRPPVIRSAGPGGHTRARQTDPARSVLVTEPIRPGLTAVLTRSAMPRAQRIRLAYASGWSPASCATLARQSARSAWQMRSRSSMAVRACSGEGSSDACNAEAKRTCASSGTLIVISIACLSPSGISGSADPAVPRLIV
nr:hypothetical protein GCM10020093_054460 [Planobispora longispora]